MSDRSWLRSLRIRVGATQQPWKFLVGLVYGFAIISVVFSLTALAATWWVDVSVAPLWVWLAAASFFAFLVGWAE